MCSSEANIQTSTDLIFILSSHDDGIIEVFNDYQAANTAREILSDDGIYSWCDTFISSYKINKEGNN
jgi:spermidine synthase